MQHNIKDISQNNINSNDPRHNSNNIIHSKAAQRCSVENVALGVMNHAHANINGSLINRHNNAVPDPCKTLTNLYQPMNMNQNDYHMIQNQC